MLSGFIGSLLVSGDDDGAFCFCFFYFFYLFFKLVHFYLQAIDFGVVASSHVFDFFLQVLDGFAVVSVGFNFFLGSVTFFLDVVF